MTIAVTQLRTKSSASHSATFARLVQLLRGYKNVSALDTCKRIGVTGARRERPTRSEVTLYSSRYASSLPLALIMFSCTVQSELWPGRLRHFQCDALFLP